MSNVDFTEIIKRMDEMLVHLKEISRPPSTGRRVVDGLATGAGILGILSAVDILKAWLGG